MPLPRRTLEELEAIHRHEPTTKDVIVEGVSDKCLVEWFLQENGVDHVVVYDIDSFDIDAQRVSAHGLDVSNRGRVITLALALEPTLSDKTSVTCVADSDFDIVLSARRTSNILLYTDYSCMEMYLFNTRVVNKYLKLHLRTFPKSAALVLAEIGNALQDLFVIRLSNLVLNLNLESVAWEKSCTLTDKGVVLDFDDYINRYLNKNKKAPLKHPFVQECRTRRRQLLKDPRNQVNGHDFIGLLSWYIGQHKGFSRVPSTSLERDLFGSAEVQDIRSGTLFASILNRCKN